MYIIKYNQIIKVFVKCRWRTEFRAGSMRRQDNVRKK